jgi:hypothetical protein
MASYNICLFKRYASLILRRIKFRFTALLWIFLGTLTVIFTGDRLLDV